MTASHIGPQSRTMKVLHAVLIGFLTGGLAALQTVLLSGNLTEKKALIAAGIGVLSAAGARAVGALLAAIETPS